MEQEKKKLTLKDFLSEKDLQKTLFVSLLGDDNENYNLFKVYRGDPNGPVLTQEIYNDYSDYRNKY